MAIERFRGRHPVYWGPFFGLRGLQEEMNRLFSDFFGEVPEKGLAAVTPAVDLIDKKDRILVKVELPGISREDVEISLKDDLLTISGEKKEEKEEKGENRYYMERSYGRFSRTLTLPVRVKGEKVKATFKDGVLEVTLPKAEEEKAREVQVKVE
ncbi:MAG: Hsp20/alpha crystallin family protein [bacterium]|nr:MAG: Hsp20/alpha crystallin family protein [bacterium]